MYGFETPFQRSLLRIMKAHGYDFTGNPNVEVLGAMFFVFEEERVKRFMLDGVSWWGVDGLLDAYRLTLAPHENPHDITALMRLYSLRRWIALHRRALPEATPLSLKKGIAAIDLPSVGSSDIFAAIKQDRKLLKGQHDTNLRSWNGDLNDVATSHASFVDQANFNALCNVSARFVVACQAAINWVNALQAASLDACSDMLPVLRTFSTANYMFSVHPIAINLEEVCGLRDISGKKLASPGGSMADSDRYDAAMALVDAREQVPIRLEVRVTTDAGTRILPGLSYYLVPLAARQDRYALRFIANQALQRAVRRMRNIEKREKERSR